MTIHKSQGGTFDEIVYPCEKIHTRDMVYVALSRVTRSEGLFITTPADDETKFKFYHNWQQSSSALSLIQEFQRLSLNTLETRASVITNLISNNKISLYIRLTAKVYTVTKMTYRIQFLKNAMFYCSPRRG